MRRVHFAHQTVCCLVTLHRRCPCQRRAKLSANAGYPPVKGAYYSCVNLGFGTREWTFPASTAHSFLSLPRQAPWSPHAARVLCMLSKIVYEVLALRCGALHHLSAAQAHAEPASASVLRAQEFLDAPVCQTLLKSLPLVKAELVAGFQFTRINFDGQPPGAFPGSPAVACAKVQRCAPASEAPGLRAQAGRTCRACRCARLQQYVPALLFLANPEADEDVRRWP